MLNIDTTYTLFCAWCTQSLIHSSYYHKKFLLLNVTSRPRLCLEPFGGFHLGDVGVNLVVFGESGVFDQSVLERLGHGVRHLLGVAGDEEPPAPVEDGLADQAGLSVHLVLDVDDVFIRVVSAKDGLKVQPCAK